MMRSPLLEALIEQQHYPLITEENVDTFLQQHDNVVLFFTENPQNFPESNDVAVVLPELLDQFSDRLTMGVISEEAERSLHKRYAFNKWPALVFLRKGEYLGVITGMQNWQEYKVEFENLLKATPSKPPAFEIPVVAGANSHCQ